MAPDGPLQVARAGRVLTVPMGRGASAVISALSPNAAPDREDDRARDHDRAHLGAIVLTGDADDWSAVAQDEPEFGALLEECPFPVVAALEGAFGGAAAELILAAHYRLASPTATVRLPALRSGDAPSLGATQRLPRLAGAAVARRLLEEGRPVDAPEAARLGVIDGVARGNVAAAAASLARRLIAAGAGPRPVGGRGIPSGQVDRPCAAFRRRAPAAASALDACFEAARSRPIAEGLALERAYSDELLTGREASALRHLARAAASEAAVPAGATRPRPVDRIAVLGLETALSVHPSALVSALISKGCDVTLAGPNRTALMAARASLPAGAAAPRGLLFGEEAPADLLLRVAGPTLFAQFGDGPQIALRLAGVGAQPTLLEIGPAEPDAQTALAVLAARSGLTVSSPATEPMQAALATAVGRLLEDGMTPVALDRAAEAAGFGAGPCAVLDALGFGVETAAPTTDPRMRPDSVAAQLRRAGRTGRRDGAGFHSYPDPFGPPRRAEEAEAAARAAWVAAGRPDPVDAADVAPRLILALALAARASAAPATALDLAAVEGLGFPAALGGPVHWLATEGEDAVRAEVERRAAQDDAAYWRWTG
ncbi:MAG: enoyl-CoA hydratase-related protein [Pseudomonadota bacterium]